MFQAADIVAGRRLELSYVLKPTKDVLRIPLPQQPRAGTVTLSIEGDRGDCAARTDVRAEEIVIPCTDRQLDKVTLSYSYTREIRHRFQIPQQGLGVWSVRIDDQEAAFDRVGDELLVNPQLVREDSVVTLTFKGQEVPE